MACNCGRNRDNGTAEAPAGPYGTIPPTPTTQATATQPATQQSQGFATRAQSYSYIPPTGQAQTFGSKLEAEAALARNGRRGRVAPLQCC
jgi:hypothetical protein